MDYKRNHFIPRFMLDYWVDPLASQPGVHVYDIQRKRTRFASGRGGKAYSFAIANDLYVHSVGGSRAVGLERWFSGLEGALAALARQAHERRDSIAYGASEDCTKALMAIFGLECRSPYNVRIIEQKLASDESLRKLLDPDSVAPAEQQVLENIVHYVSDRVADYTPTEMIFMVAPESRSWLLCDRPYFHQPDLGYRFVVLTNKILLGFKRSSDVPKYNYVDANAEIFALLNHHIALQARDWLVADSSATLGEFEAVVESTEWEKNVASDHISYEPIRNLNGGWRISS